MGSTILQTRVDKDLKKEADLLFNSLGLDTTTAIRIFLKQAINQQKIPFEIIPPQPNFNQETLDAIEEARRISRDPSVPSYTSAKELLEACEE